jgi:hypothetical protein
VKYIKAEKNAEKSIAGTNPEYIRLNLSTKKFLNLYSGFCTFLNKELAISIPERAKNSNTATPPMVLPTRKKGSPKTGWYFVRK